MKDIDNINPWPHYTRPIEPFETDIINAYYTAITGLVPSTMPSEDRAKLEDLLINANPPS